MNTLRKGYVYVQDVYAGTLSETDEGYCFSYDESYLEKKGVKPLSLTMPLQKESYFSKNTLSLFWRAYPGRMAFGCPFQELENRRERSFWVIACLVQGRHW